MTSRWFNFPNWWSFVYWTLKIFRLKKQSCVWISGKTRRNLFWWINPLFSHQVTSLCVHGKWDLFQPITIKVFNFQFSISLTWCFMRIHTKFGAIGLVRLLTLHWISISNFFVLEFQFALLFVIYSSWEFEGQRGQSLRQMSIQKRKWRLLCPTNLKWALINNPATLNLSKYVSHNIHSPISFIYN